MDIKQIFTKKGIIFFVIFILMVLIGKGINFSPLIGAENQFFTLFQFFGPIASGFLGPVIGVLTVLFAEVGNFLINRSEWTVINLIRLTPMLFAVYYFGTKRNKINIVVPLIAMALFILHPVGRQVWFFSLYWLIPVVVKVVPRFSKNLFAKSLGATFTAHAVGGAAWIYTIPMTASQWLTLIPIVAYERLLFASGIALSYLAVNAVLAKIDTKLTTGFVNINKKYLLKNLFRFKA